MVREASSNGCKQRRAEAIASNSKWRRLQAVASGGDCKQRQAEAATSGGGCKQWRENVEEGESPTSIFKAGQIWGRQALPLSSHFHALNRHRRRRKPRLRLQSQPNLGEWCINGLRLGLKKWSKGKQKEKVNNVVLFDQVNYDKMLSEFPKYKLITPSVLFERLWV
ncbi:hypothetical protein ZIOFF_043245 [Zingiber officinale]|uniref:40S ribosomal protein S25 n=1 Tax=Zingiber officinale TaxID=94328 RepID=A0A8J5GAB6_ZINOF|nr:hypothetical protein ZIOFF_043245 [Zingiber officinale]